MNLKQLKPRKALNKAFLKLKPNRSEIEIFKTNLIQLLDRINDKESEEFHKFLIVDFLKKTYYEPNHFINTKGRTDLVIHNGNNANSTVGVIVETKKPTNKSEMLTQEKINVKAFQEMVLYYLRERITHKNLEIRYLIATNINEWFVFDANIFEKHFAHNKSFVKQFNEFENGRMSGKTTDFFYKEIAEPFIESITNEIEYSYFDIREYEKPLRNNDKKDDNKLIALYKLLSPEHLLKLPFTNDSNTLDKRFYGELLHIIGLIETKEGGKKIIERNKEGYRNSGSLLENAIIELDSLDKISRLEKPSQFGSNMQERLFSVALELSITWINRILFLKLLEAQLITYHKGDKSYSFLNFDKIKNYDDLNSLFFKVLARKFEDRNSEISAVFEKVPYLNSSLFEPTDLEHTTLFISNLRDEKQVPIYSATVLKNEQGKKKTGTLNSLEYLFEFLNAYDFTSEGSEEIQEDNKTLINASVLGLIFEKINGYKDGSFFTPGFITMYMCRETIRKAVVQKFNETKNWECKTIDELYDKIEDRKEANEIVNSIKICDPAVGSGHFLVSALNEIIAVKNDLKILQDREGKRLKEFHIEVVNDELITTDDDGLIFEYNPKSKESQRVQVTLFHEKQTIIENCLFGVDINPNSVKICRLRLWIELLKNAYYKNETELETLPNIDINIKCGNSLVSRFAIDADLGQALKKSKWNIDSYRLAVSTYRNAQNKEQKREMERLIADIKSDFRSEIASNDPKLKRLQRIKGELFTLTNQTTLFEKSKKEKGEWNKRVQKFTDEIKKLDSEIEEIKNNKIYENAFEWRFEFPEVLNENGDFIGFDVVIGNPPYIRQEELKEIKPYLQTHFSSFAGTADLYVFFIELGIRNLKSNGEFVFIVPNKWMRAGYGKSLRTFIKKLKINFIIDFGDLPVFEEATTYPSILSISKSQASKSFKAVNLDTLLFGDKMTEYLHKNQIDVLQDELQESGWTLSDSISQKLVRKLKENGNHLGEIVNAKIFRGILTGCNEAFIIDDETKNNLILKDNSSIELIKPFLDGKDIKKYTNPNVEKFLIFTRRGVDISKYPAILEHLENYKERLEPKPESYKGTDWKGRKPGSYKWYEIQDAVDYFNEFEREKIVWSETSFENQLTIVDKGIYLNKTTFMMPINDLSLLGIMNSNTVKFYLNSIVSKVRGGYYSLSKAYVETTPIPYVNETTKIHIENKVKTILEMKKSDSKADTFTIENEINQLVYELFNLTKEEIEIIEST
ncbi:class I SAM-dependent DNA methyltransferase [Perlabentimonas gracilis]|uniref:class I SAM-dependent DNA methyltransferase n=1 Tax=Perlabentimonas gracilis TaxID=2715279 RepID=UPI00140AF88C|nr:TaqI-like C-terminal specificity domain-containing protein [Perlabentimonas gracilis]NHB70296.1 class I SAM-dependent DNA methyltransferase [Perlabentimonas gracilis]